MGLKTYYQFLTGLMLAMHENHTVVEREQKILKCFKFAVLHIEHCTHRIKCDLLF